MKPKGIEPARTTARPAPKSSRATGTNKKRARRVSARAAIKTAQRSAALPSEYKPVKLAEALREQGIDERKIAEGYASLHDKLGQSDDKGDLKLLVDVLEKNTRTLDPPRPPDRNSGDSPVTVILKHCVPRPQR